MPFFLFFVGSYKVGKLNVSTETVQRKPVCKQTGSLLRTFSQRAGS